MIVHVPSLLRVLLLLYEFVAVTLRDELYANNSVLLLTDIGRGDKILLCQTDNTHCCRESDNPNGDSLGEWYFPIGSAPSSDSDNSIYTKKGLGVVELYRWKSVQSPTGVYRCEIPDARGNTQNIFVGVSTNGNQGNISSTNSHKKMLTSQEHPVSSLSSLS